MSYATHAAAATVRGLITGHNPDRTTGASITGLRTALGDTITAAVYGSPITTAAQINTRLDLADLDRGDRDHDLALVIDPSALPGIDHDQADAWNVHMTLPTLLRILGTDPTTTQKAQP